MTSLNSRVLSQQTQAKLSGSVGLSSISRPTVSNHIGAVESQAPPLTIHITHEVGQVRVLPPPRLTTARAVNQRRSHINTDGCCLRWAQDWDSGDMDYADRPMKSSR